jgi:DNA-binding LacI/PurR family transcriptional regulator
LTTVSQNPYQQGADATRVLLAELDGRAHADSFPSAPFELIVRSSTGPPPAFQRDATW